MTEGRFGALSIPACSQRKDILELLEGDLELSRSLEAFFLENHGQWPLSRHRPHFLVVIVVLVGCSRSILSPVSRLILLHHGIFYRIPASN